MFYVNYEVYFVHYYLKTQFKSFFCPLSLLHSVLQSVTFSRAVQRLAANDEMINVCWCWGERSQHRLICLFGPQGSSSDSEGEVSSKSFLKKKPEAPSEATDRSQTAKESEVRGHLTKLQQEKRKIWWERHNTCTVTWAKI